MAVKAIARQMGISKNTVKRALASDRPPRYQRAGSGSVVDAVEPAIRELLKQTPTMPVTVIAERIGWERGLSVRRERVRELRPGYPVACRSSMSSTGCGRHPMRCPHPTKWRPRSRPGCAIRVSVLHWKKAPGWHRS
jgi:hypothetical protein